MDSTLDNPNLISLECWSNQLASIDVSKCPALDSINFSNNPPLQILNFGDVRPRKLYETGSGYLNHPRISDGIHLKIISSKFDKIDVYNHSLLSLDVSQCPELIDYTFFTNNLELLTLNDKITEFSVSMSCCKLKIIGPKLEKIDFYNEKRELETLDVSECPMLQELYCSNCSLTSLDVSKNINLRKLTCSDNALSSLDVSKNINLESLNCNNNFLATLDVSKNVNLNTLWCENNRLTAIDVSKNIYLKTFYCKKNPLESINSGNNDLDFTFKSNDLLTSTKLEIIGTKINWLHISKNKLKTLKITSNSLRIANVSKNILQSLLLDTPNLEDLYASENQLISLDIKTPNRLRKIDVSNNLFTFLDVSNYNFLEELICKIMPTLKTIITKNATIDCDYNPVHIPEHTRSEIRRRSQRLREAK